MDVSDSMEQTDVAPNRLAAAAPRSRSWTSCPRVPGRPRDLRGRGRARGRADPGPGAGDRSAREPDDRARDRDRRRPGRGVGRDRSGPGGGPGDAGRGPAAVRRPRHREPVPPAEAAARAPATSRSRSSPSSLVRCPEKAGRAPTWKRCSRSPRRAGRHVHRGDVRRADEVLHGPRVGALGRSRAPLVRHAFRGRRDRADDYSGLLFIFLPRSLPVAVARPFPRSRRGNDPEGEHGSGGDRWHSR